MTGVRVAIEGLDRMVAVLGDVARRTENPLGLWETVGAALEASTRQRFIDGAGPSGSPWPPSLRARMEGGKTLVDSARLMQSITSNASDTGVEVGTNVLYAAIHQFGGTIRAKTSRGLRFKIGKGRDASWATRQSVTIPARPFLGIDAEDEAEIIQIATDWLTPGEADAD